MMVLPATQGQRKDILAAPLHSRRRGKGSQQSFANKSHQEIEQKGSSGGGEVQDNDGPAAGYAYSCTSNLVLLCTQNSLAHQARTQLALCPPGRNRRNLQGALRKNSNRSTAVVSSGKSLGPETTTDNEYLSNTTTFDLESDEEESSGDEDELLDLNDLLVGGPPRTMYNDTTTLPEPLYVPAGGGGGGGADQENNKLPFSFRKVRYFDAATAPDRRLARDYLQKELKKAKRRTVMNRLNKRGGSIGELEPMTKFKGADRMSAALLLESLLLNPLESVEGMAKCYDGIVAAGVALQQNGTRPQVLKALAPLLISSLEQASGQVILQLARMRRLCATPRYQRRFVQRIGPYLVRPARGAPWCLRHQHDMEAILAACELILDSAEDLFCGTWYEKGQQLLRDSVRKQTLNFAAQQLKDLSTPVNNVFGSKRFKETLAEWEVMAVDCQIRISISNVFTRDWSKVAVPLRDDQLKHNRRKNSKSQASPRNHSPSRSVKSTKSSKSIKSPKFHPSHGAPPAPDSVDSTFAPSFGGASMDGSGPEMPLSPRLEKTLHEVKSPPRSPSSPPNTPSSTLRSPPPTHSEAAAPLSPQLSIGHASVASDNAPNRSSSNASVVSTGSASSQPAHYRMLTSTAAERKRTVAACRALRSQIQRFEEAFMQLHGRPPKGAAERTPLATTYAQYREWKRAIRADAACRIQALFRGYWKRKMLLESNDSRLVRVVRTGAGRSFGYKLDDRLSIPNDFGLSEPERQPGLALMPSRPEKPGTVGLEDFAPKVWPSPVPQPPRRSLSPPSFASTPPPAGSNAELALMTVPELHARKRELKQQLKQYDMSFARTHGRMPVKAEKEPIRHLYEMYNTLKSRLTTIEKEAAQKPAPPLPLVIPIMPRIVQQQRTSSPPTTDDRSSASGSPEPAPLLRSNKQKQQGKQPKQHPIYSPPDTSTASAPQPSSTTTTTTPSSLPSQDLAALKTEKGKLHQMLRSYEKDFFKEHRRQVSSFADIKPVASQYRRYKEIKKAISALQQQER